MEKKKPLKDRALEKAVSEMDEIADLSDNHGLVGSALLGVVGGIATFASPVAAVVTWPGAIIGGATVGAGMWVAGKVWKGVKNKR